MTEQLSFEEAMTQLEEIIERLETGALSLDETLTLYERGQSLIALCGDTLDKAELRLEQLRADTGETVPFDAAGE
jgi:exodeoxyribonuclease VII small subunit